MDVLVNEASCSDLFALCGRAIRVTLIAKKTAVGNLYTVDPESRSIIILECHEEKLTLIPQDSILKVELLSDDEIDHSETCVKQTPDLDNLINNMFKPPAVNDLQSTRGTPEERKTKIEEILQKGRLRYELDTEGSIVVGAVKIKHPYTKEACISSNNIALGRVVKLIEPVFP